MIDYMMYEKDSFLRVSYYYDETGRWAEKFPVGVRTKDRIIIRILDSSGFFAGKTGRLLLSEFERRLFNIKYVLGYMCSDLDNDVVAGFSDNSGKNLGYFYEGEYHLWKD